MHGSTNVEAPELVKFQIIEARATVGAITITKAPNAMEALV